jgi:Tol biopolymer transport system component
VKWEVLAGSWFPDSKSFFANAHPPDQIGSAWTSETSSIWIVSITGGPPRKLRDDAIAWAVSPDGSAISFGTNWGTLDTRELWLMAPDGGQAHRLYEVDDKHGICCLSYFLPKGQRIAYLSTDKSGDSLVARDLKGGPVVTLMPSSEIKKIGSDFSFLPDGRLIYSDPCNGLGAGAFDYPCNYWIKRFDIRTGEVVEKPRRLTNWAGFSLGDLSVSADGKRVAFLESSNRGLSYLADLEAGGMRLVNSRRFTMEEGGDDGITDWTSDGKTVILAQNRNGHYSLRKQSLNSDTQETIVSAAAGALENAVLSPDGKWVIIAVYAGPSMPRPLMRVPIKGGSPELILLRPAWGAGFSCAKHSSYLCALVEQSEDHKQMVVTALDAIKGRGAELARFDLDQDFKQNVDHLLCSISPDGTRLAALRGPRGPVQIRYLRSGRTQTIPVKSLYRMQNVSWAADGNGLFVSNMTHDGSEIVHVDLLGNTKVLWQSNSDTSFVTPSPDGRHLAIFENRQSANIWMMENF